MDDELQELLIAAERRFRTTWTAKSQRFFFRMIRSYFILLVKCIFWIRDLTIFVLNATYYMLIAPLDLAVTTCYFGAVFTAKRSTASQMKTPANNRIIELSLIRKLLWNGCGISVGRYLSSLTIPSTILDHEDIQQAKQWIPTEQISLNEPISMTRSISMNHRPLSIGNYFNDDELINQPKRSSGQRRHSMISRIQPNNWSNNEDIYQQEQQLQQQKPSLIDHAQNMISNTLNRSLPGILSHSMADGTDTLGRSLPTDGLRGTIPTDINRSIAPDISRSLPIDALSRSIPADSYLNRVPSSSRHHHYGRRIYTKSSSLLKKTSPNKK